MLKDGKDNLPIRRTLRIEILEVREISHIVAVPARGLEIQGLRKKPRPAGGIHQQLRMDAIHPRRRQTLLRQLDFTSRAPFPHLRPVMHELHPELLRPDPQQVVKLGARDVVGIVRRFSQDTLGKQKIDPLPAPVRWRCTLRR